VSGDPARGLRDFLTGYLTPGGQWYNARRCFGDAPGKAWSYSNVAIALLGYLSERVGADLKTCTQRDLFSPLGMHNTSWTYDGLKPKTVATPYDASDGAPKALRPVGYPDWPAGLLRTSANDFARFLAVHTADGALGGRVYLKPETLAAMMTVQPGSPSAGDGQQQGLVWRLQSFGPVRVALHAGGDPGASALVTVVPSQKIALLVFANAAGHPDFDQFRSEIVNRLAQRASA
jgi:CubicO group peptidase (beta-lactamase class C family)